MQQNHNDRIDYLPIDEWRKAVREAIMRNESERRTAEEHLATLAAEYERLRDEEELITQAIRAYMARLEAPSKRLQLGGSSLREILIIHFADSDGTIIGREASKALVDIGYFSDRGRADGAIYTILSKHPFVKRFKGIYFVPTNSSDWRSLRQGNGYRPNGDVKEDINSDRTPQYQSASVQSIRRAQVEAIVSEAKRRNGYMRSNQAKELLQQTKLITNPKTVGWDAHHVLTESGKFVKVERGLYLLAK